ncbi:MAG: ImuA family protein [Geminicoccaceae bacterium]
MSPKPRHVHRESAPADRRAVLERLRARLACLEALGRGGSATVALGLPGIDGALPGGGLARGCLHELCGAPAFGAALGFAAALLGRLMADGGHVVWIGPRDELFGPGLAELGLTPERLIVVRARPQKARLWALEEALRSPGLAAALAEVDQLSLTQSRRLQLAAAAKGVTAFLLRSLQAGTTPSAAVTRWRIATASGGPRRASGVAHWQIDLFRCRGGRTGSWRIACHGDGRHGDGRHGDGWHEVPDSLALAAEPADRSAAAPRPAPPRRA